MWQTLDHDLTGQPISLSQNIYIFKKVTLALWKWNIFLEECKAFNDLFLTSESQQSMSMDSTLISMTFTLIKLVRIITFSQILVQRHTSRILGVCKGSPGIPKSQIQMGWNPTWLTGPCGPSALVICFQSGVHRIFGIQDLYFKVSVLKSQFQQGWNPKIPTSNDWNPKIPNCLIHP